ncbi:MAG: hypothetical protein AAGE18_11985 [Pseudomonadota bacterium]
MSFIRPEVKRLLAPWGEVLLLSALAALAAGLLIRGVSRGAEGMVMLGTASLVLSLSLLGPALPRALVRWRRGRGIGVVMVEERQITFFGPTGGGSVALDTIVAIAADARGWQITTSEPQILSVPTGAVGEDRLIAALSALPGFSLADLLRARSSPTNAPMVIWQNHGADAVSPLSTP